MEQVISINPDDQIKYNPVCVAEPVVPTCPKNQPFSFGFMCCAVQPNAEGYCPEGADSSNCNDHYPEPGKYKCADHPTAVRVEEKPAWTTWTEWSECSKSCANTRGEGYDRGEHRRSRTCKAGKKEVDESKCQGVHYDYKDCKNTVCQDDPIYVCDKSGFNKREGGTYAIWTNREFKEHEIINRG